MKHPAPDLTCPSAPCKPGATLVGILGADGRVDYLRTAMVVDDAFVQDAHKLGPPEARMRFAAPCRTVDCVQWTKDGCGVLRKIVSHLAQTPEHTEGPGLQPCLIRHSCRWFAEVKDTACKACKLVVTDQLSL